MKSTYLYIKTFAVAAVMIATTSCNDFLDRQPIAQIDPNVMFESETSAEAAVNGMYRTMMNSFSFGQSILVVPEFSANHLSHVNIFPEYENFATHGVIDPGGSIPSQPVPPNNNWLASIWQATYATINAANNIIATVPEVPAQAISEEKRDLFVGEAKFVRALNYFFLVRAFGNVPLETEPTNESDNPLAPQADPETLYALILTDLSDAVELLASNTSEASKGRANQWAAKALLAKVHLYHATLFSNDFTQAAALAEDVIGNGPFSLVGNFASIWQTENTSESIFELQFDEQAANPLASAIGDNAGNLFYARGTIPYDLYDEDDFRRAVTVKPGTREGFLNRQYIAKFPNLVPPTQNMPLIRLAEVYLIHAEARARVDNAVTTASHESLFAVQDRAGVGEPITSYTDLDSYIIAIQEEKEKELMFEGETWFDFCRTGLALTKYTTLTHQNYFIYPIPIAQFQVDGSLRQNPGYN